jgi:hypothetical protein
VDIEHPHAQTGCLSRCADNLLRAVVKLQIEEDFGATPANLAYEIGAAANEQRSADFEHPDHASELIHEAKCLLPITEVKRYNQSLAQCALAYQAGEWPVLRHPSALLSGTLRSSSHEYAAAAGSQGKRHEARDAVRLLHRRDCAFEAIYAGEYL